MQVIILLYAVIFTSIYCFEFAKAEMIAYQDSFPNPDVDPLTLPEVAHYTVIDQDVSIWGKDAEETERIFQQANFVPSQGDIILFGDYKPGCCEKVIKNEINEPELPLPRDRSDFGFADNVPKVYRKADYLSVKDEWQDRFVYTDGPFTSVTDQRLNFSAYLREQGILSTIADFIVNVEEMTDADRPTPEDLLEHFLTHAGHTAHLQAKQRKVELIESQDAEKADLLDKINALILEGSDLRTQLDEYEFQFQSYESLNPDVYTNFGVEEPYADFQARFWQGSKINYFTEADNPLNALLKAGETDGKASKKGKDKKDKSKDKKDKSKDKSKDKKDKSKDKKDKSKDKKDKSKDKGDKKSKEKSKDKKGKK